MAFGKCLATAALVVASFAAAVSRATPSDSSATVCGLALPPGSLEVGRQGPCACAAVPLPDWGSFELAPTGSDPLFTHYDVRRFIASFWNGPGAVSITGTGHYSIGGEVALMQRMPLDLQIEGRPLLHFDSALVPVRRASPGSRSPARCIRSDASTPSWSSRRSR